VSHLPDAVLIDNRSIGSETLIAWQKATNRSIHLIQIHNGSSLPQIHLPNVLSIGCRATPAIISPILPPWD
jgi:hypothetical protein